MEIPILKDKDGNYRPSRDPAYASTWVRLDGRKAERLYTQLFMLGYPCGVSANKLYSMAVSRYTDNDYIVTYCEQYGWEIERGAIKELENLTKEMTGENTTEDN